MVIALIISHQPDNIPAGTQVVAQIEVRGTNHSLVHPRGAVGIVTRTPAVVGEKFIIRFPDGFETSLDRSQFEVLKYFKDRLNVLPTSCWQIALTLIVGDEVTRLILLPRKVRVS